MSRFELSVAPSDAAAANLWVIADDRDQPTALHLGLKSNTGRVLAQARVKWGGVQNPLISALPAQIGHPLEQDPDMRALVTLFVSELQSPRCGGASVLSRLGEVLVVRLMRAQIEAGAMETGLLAALADPRLSRAVVAIHDRPGQIWRLESLADEAGLSPSRFSELFRTTLGVPPLAYLRGWRLVLARQDIERGDRIQRVANRYGYGSSEALSRAISTTFGQTPIQLRKSARATAPA